MANSPNKGYILQGVGDNAGSWGTVLNDNMISYVDLNLGGIVTKSLSSSNVTLSASESRHAILRLTGTLLANVIVTTECLGFFFVENLTTGSFTVTIKNSSTATSVTIPQSTRATLISDASNGVRIASSDEGFVTGTSMLFLQAAAPTGWTKSTTHNNKALRIVSGTGGASGGTTAFTSVFTTRTLARSDLPNVTITTSTNGEHTHPLSFTASGGDDPAGGNNAFSTDNTSRSGPYTPTYFTMVSAGDHTHSFALNGGVTQTALDFAVQYVDAIICVKN